MPAVTQETHSRRIAPPPDAPFQLGGWTCDPTIGRFLFHYRIGPDLAATETIDFGTPVAPHWLEMSAFRRLVDYTALALGISYFKAFTPPSITAPTQMLTPRAAHFFERFYREGLGEFAARNGLTLAIHIDPAMIDPAPAVYGGDRFDVPDRSAILIGGGKDSIVALEVIKARETAPVGLSVNPRPIMEQCAARAGLPLIGIRRTLDPVLMEWNRRGAMNGHVPVTGIIFFLSLIAGCLHGFNRVVAANERSADEGNTLYNGLPVNHQFSKSSAFEELFRDLIDHDITPTLRVYSVIRTWSEIAVAARFATHNVYDDVFSSCNGNFKQTQSADHSKGRWCGDCPKCRFTFLALAPFMPRTRLIGIIGRDLLDDPLQVDGFRALLGIDSAAKPWECVGTFDESRTLLHRLSTLTDWRDRIAVRSLAPLLPHADYAAQWVRFLDHERGLA